VISQSKSYTKKFGDTHQPTQNTPILSSSGHEAHSEIKPDLATPDIGTVTQHHDSPTSKFHGSVEPSLQPEAS
jgi:hypothetical protein